MPSAIIPVSAASFPVIPPGALSAEVIRACTGLVLRRRTLKRRLRNLRGFLLHGNVMRMRPMCDSRNLTAAHDYSDLHELIDHLELDQAEKLRAFARRLVKPESQRLRVWRTFEGPRTDLAPPAKSCAPSSAGALLIV